jgi:hypothetical protein
VPLRVTSDLLTWRVYVPTEREITAFGGDLERVERRGSWAFELLDDVTRLLRRKPAGQPIDLSRMIHDLERGSPFQVQADGTAYLFSNRTGTGTVSITSVNPTGFLFLKLALLVGAFIGARFLVRESVRRGRGTLVALVALSVLLLLLLIPAGPGMSAVLTAMWVGVLLAGFLSFVSFVIRSRAEAKAARATHLKRSSTPASAPPSASPSTPPSSPPTSPLAPSGGAS